MLASSQRVSRFMNARAPTTKYRAAAPSTIHSIGRSASLGVPAATGGASPLRERRPPRQPHQPEGVEQRHAGRGRQHVEEDQPENDSLVPHPPDPSGGMRT